MRGLGACLILLSNPVLAIELARALKADGRDVEVADAAVPALALLHGRRFAAVVTDAGIDGVSGRMLLRSMRKLDPGVAIIALGLTPDEANPLGLLAQLPHAIDLQPLLDLVRVARRGRIVAVVDAAGPATTGLRAALQRGGYATVWFPSTAARDPAPSIDLLAAIVEPRLTGEPDGAPMEWVARHHPGLPQIALTASDAALPVPPVLALRKPARLALLLTALDRLPPVGRPT